MLLRRSVALSACLLLAITASASAQDAPSAGWVDVNFLGVRSAQDATFVSEDRSLFNETATAEASYPEVSGTGRIVEVGAGFRFGGDRRSIGVGVHFGGLNIESTAAVAIRIPHPAFFNRPGVDLAFTDVLEREDRAVDIQLLYFLPTPDAVTLRVFGGPTYFRVTENRVSGISYSQLVDLAGGNLVDITNIDTEEADGSAWGYNLGGDVAWFFSRHVGVGGTVRFNQGTVEITDPLIEAEVERDAGQVAFGGGLRVRF